MPKFERDCEETKNQKQHTATLPNLFQCVWNTVPVLKSCSSWQLLLLLPVTLEATLKQPIICRRCCCCWANTRSRLARSVLPVASSQPGIERKIKLFNKTVLEHFVSETYQRWSPRRLLHARAASWNGAQTVRQSQLHPEQNKKIWFCPSYVPVPITVEVLVPVPRLCTGNLRNSTNEIWQFQHHGRWPEPGEYRHRYHSVQVYTLYNKHTIPESALKTL